MKKKYRFYITFVSGLTINHEYVTMEAKNKEDAIRDIKSLALIICDSGTYYNGEFVYCFKFTEEVQ